MMQFTADIPFSPPLPPPPISLHHHQSPLAMNRAAAIRPWPGGFPTSSKSLSSANFGDTNCMEQLLVHCAEAIENNDATPAQQILWVLNNIARPDGDSTQRLTCAFLRALISRAALTGTCKMQLIPNLNPVHSPHKFSLLELAHFVDLTPWHRFGFTAANSVILDAISGDLPPAVHIVDLSISHCMQMPTLIDAIATRFDQFPGQVPPVLKLTVGAISDDIPPVFDLFSYEELGMRLINFARSRNIVLEFKAVPTSPSDGFASLLEEVRQSKMYSSTGVQESIIMNFQMSLHLLQEDQEVSMRGMFLQAVRSLEPCMVVMVEEDADFTARSLVGRLRAAFNYMWIPFDTVDTFLPKGSEQREWFEAEVWWRIENVIAHEGMRRVERQEPRGRWALRMRDAHFRGVDFGEGATSEVKAMLEEHAAGWGSKKEEDDLVLTWKGHNVVFASAWFPTS